ncbi:hypothetical protein MKX01_036151 [Papaver californicum]|nr:hypothetical protein MKX01_036151 [Papaver californicum]
MDNSADTLNNVYLEFVGVVAGVLEANEIFENFKQRWELFKVACDQSEKFVESMSKVIRWLVIELQEGSGASGAAAHTPSFVPFDARFSEGADQQVQTNSTIC